MCGFDDEKIAKYVLISDIMQVMDNNIGVDVELFSDILYVVFENIKDDMIKLGFTNEDFYCKGMSENINDYLYSMERKINEMME